MPKEGGNFKFVGISCSEIRKICLYIGIVPLNDSWVDFTGDLWGGETNETPENSFTYNVAMAKRIDYIMYRAGPCLDAETVNCWFPLPNRYPKVFSSKFHH